VIEAIKLLEGNKEGFAIESVITDSTDCCGNLFLYVNGKKIGQNHFAEELNDLCFRLLAHKSDRAISNQEKLFLTSGKDIYNYFMCAWERKETSCNEYKELLTRKEFDYIDMNLTIHAGYAFDDYFILLIPFNDKEKLIVAKIDNEMPEEIILNKGEFFGKIATMCKRIQKHMSL